MQRVTLFRGVVLTRAYIEENRMMLTYSYICVLQMFVDFLFVSLGAMYNSLSTLAMSLHEMTNYMTLLLRDVPPVEEDIEVD